LLHSALDGASNLKGFQLFTQAFGDGSIAGGAFPTDNLAIRQTHGIGLVEGHSVFNFSFIEI
jgi:hypothetical protein